MPKLFDLLPDDAKKGLIAETQKMSGGNKNAPFVRDRNDKSGEDGRRPRDAQNVRHDGKPARFQQSAAVPDFVAIDVETTGLEFKADRVIEVGAIRFTGGKPDAEFSTFINPGIPIPDYITRLTKITDSDVCSAPYFSDIAARLVEFIGPLPICGHQADFDLTFINEELKRAAFPEIAPQIIDTALLSRVLLQQMTMRFSLTHVCEALSVTLNIAHRALHDAKASGEAAVKLIPMINNLPLDIRRALAAFAPASMFKTLTVRSLGGTRYGIDLANGTPFANRQSKIETPEHYLETDINIVDKIFSDGHGNANKIVKNFIPRPAQKEMARNVAHALNNSGILVAEAGTGTGKSLAYLVPAAFHALKNNCRAIVSTHTRNLQDQLTDNDLPAVAAICESAGGENGKLRFTKLKGRNNYLCRNRFYKLLRGELGNLSARERNAVLPLIVWSQSTASGDIEEQTFFNPKWFYKAWNHISADSQECAGRRCPYYSTCFLHRARYLAQISHIVVINHALFYSDICSETSFLGPIGSIIFDEAHHLESSGHRHLRTELDTNRMNAFTDKLQNLMQAASAHKEFADVREFEKDLKNHLKHIRKRAHDLLGELDAWALSAASDSGADYQIPVCEDSLSRLLEPPVFDITLGGLQDTFHRFRQLLSSIEDKEKVDELREITAACSEQTSQLRADLQYLIAAKTEDHVFWIEGSRVKKWTKLCGVPLDISELLAQIWKRGSGGAVFTSATLSTQKGSTDYFKRAAGLEPFACKTASIILPSPYGADQMLFGAFKNCPEPDNPVFPQFAADVIAAIHSKFGKNILVLFTSNSMQNNVYTQLKSHADIDRNKLLAQGISGGSRNSMLDQFKAQNGMILLGTDSFWEGIDAPGEACEIVIIPRLPFPVPTHPLTQALGKRMEELYGSGFFSYSVPEAVIKFRQGAGRLIRSAADRGALVVLDNRIITKGYGKQFVQAIGSPINEFGDVFGMVDKMREFFESPIKQTVGPEPESTIKYVPFEDL